MANFLLEILSNTAEQVEEAGIEEGLQKIHDNNPVRYKQIITILGAAAGVMGELSAVTKSGFLKKLEEGFGIAVNDSIAHNPL